MHSPAFLSPLRGEMERPDPPRPGVLLFGLLLAAPFPSNPRRKPLPCGRRQPFHLRNEVPATFRSRNELLRRASLRTVHAAQDRHLERELRAPAYGPPRALLPALQIGRASCRERGCQYG